MTDPSEVLKNYAEKPASQKPEILAQITPKDVAAFYALLGRPGESRALLRLLVDAARKKPVSEALFSLEIKEGRIRALLADADAKVRKNAAALIGSVCAKEYAGALLNALQREETEFVLPSILLALGKTGDPEALETLKSYTPKSEVEKHREEERLALQKALSALGGGVKSLRIPDVSGFPVVITCPPGHIDLTMEELDEFGREYKNFSGFADALLVYPEKYGDLFRCRTFYEALVLLGKCKNTPESLKSFLTNPKFAESVFRLYGEGEIAYRIEVRGVDHARRKEIIETALKAIAHPKLMNSPSNYSFELRLEAGKEQVCIFVKPSPELDTRFDYRTKTLPASISPATAAALMRYVYPYLKRDADAIDPFCGSGTMLFERAKIKPYRSLTGVDNQKYAVSCALANEAAAKAGARFVLKDILDFVPRMQYDEVLSNMPFGHRVGSHEGNEALYRGFTDALSRLLKSRGMAFLYTNDKRLFTETIGRGDAFTVVDEAVFPSGNLHPSLFILLKNG
jgi:23S rRNA G2445 N2-methylase RlmL